MQATTEQSILDTAGLSSFFWHCSQHAVWLGPKEGVLEMRPGHGPDIEGGWEGPALAYCTQGSQRKYSGRPEKRYIQ